MTEGTDPFAIATFKLSTPLTSYTAVDLAVIDVSATYGDTNVDGVDYYGLQYRMGTTDDWGGDANAGWVNVPGGSGSIGINAGWGYFQVRAAIANDHVRELKESFIFTVSQNSDSVGLTNSWYVASTVKITDNTPTLIKITAAADNAVAAAGNPLIKSTFNEGQQAYGIFNLSHALDTTYGDAVVTARVIDLGTTPTGANADYGTVYYEAYAGANGTGGLLGGAGSFTGGTAQITLPNNTLSFKVYTATTANAATIEPTEYMSFAVSQNYDSTTLTGSWYVQKTVSILDTSTPAVLSVITADAGNAATVNEGSTATATFDVWPAIPAGPGADVYVRITGVGNTPDDYSALTCTAVGGGPLTITNGVVHLPAGNTGFILSTDVAPDNVVQNYESLIFSVSQKPAVIPVLTDSWWVSSTIAVQDVASSAGNHNFLAGAGQDIFTIPSGESHAVNGVFDTITGLGVYYTPTGGTALYDLINLTYTGGASGSRGAVDGGTFAAIDAAFFSAANTAHGTAVNGDVVVFHQGSGSSTNTYILVNTDNNNNFSATDTLIELVGVNIAASSIFNYLP